MSTILVVTASPRGDRSNTRGVASVFTGAWVQRHPEDRILLRDVGHHPVPHVTEPWVAAAFGEEDGLSEEANKAIAVSDQLVEEFIGADRYIFAVPMFNFNIPSTFKAYIDQIVRPGRTFAVGPNGFEGMVSGRKAIFITSSGYSYAPGSAISDKNFQEPYLRAIFGFMGLTDVNFISMENMNRGAETARLSREYAENAARELAAEW